MSHNLNIQNGSASMMYVGETPWHRLGTKLDKPATAAEAIEAAHLNFTIEKIPLKTQKLDLTIDRYFANVRIDTQEVLGVVGSHYVPIQNRDAFTMFDTLVGEGEAIYHTAGALGKGERIWILAKLPEYIRVSGDDLIEKYLLLSNSHDGSAAVRIKLTPIRVVCENTLSMALSGIEQEVRIRHVAHADDRLKEAYKILGLSNRIYAQLESIFDQMKETNLTDQLLTDYVGNIFPERTNRIRRVRRKSPREYIFELAETGQGAEGARGTLWGAYNAVTEYVDHVRQPNASQSTRLKSIWFGSGERIKRTAFRVAESMLK